MTVATAAARRRFATVSDRAADTFERALPGLKKFGVGALWGVGLFLIAAYAMGHIAGLLGVPVPQASTSDLRAAAAQYAPFLEEVSDDH